jgi:hypothetical protein
MKDKDFEGALKAPEAPSRALRTVIEWAESKGHVPHLPKVIRHRGEAIHRGPHIDVIRQHTGWPSNFLLDEQTYDKGAAEAYSLPIRES